MKKFRVLSSNGKEGEIKINHVIGEGTSVIKVDVESLKIGTKEVVYKEEGTISFLLTEDHPILEFKNNKALKLNNQYLIDYIWEESGKNKLSALYAYTTDYKNNWED